MNNVAQELRAGKFPVSPCGVAASLPQSLACRDEQRQMTPAGGLRLRHVPLPGESAVGGVMKLRLRARPDKTAARENLKAFCAKMIERFAPPGAQL
jgi:hypothetical protein